jgi:hypothetical protein
MLGQPMMGVNEKKNNTLKMKELADWASITGRARSVSMF